MIVSLQILGLLRQQTNGFGLQTSPHCTLSLTRTLSSPPWTPAALPLLPSPPCGHPSCFAPDRRPSRASLVVPGPFAAHCPPACSVPWRHWAFCSQTSLASLLLLRDFPERRSSLPSRLGVAGTALNWTSGPQGLLPPPSALSEPLGALSRLHGGSPICRPGSLSLPPTVFGTREAKAQEACAES